MMMIMITGDNLLIMQGEEPSPLNALRHRASQTNSTCLRYLVLTPSPDLNLACDTRLGRLVERTLQEEVWVIPLTGLCACVCVCVCVCVCARARARVRGGGVYCTHVE